MRLHAQTAVIENGFVHIPETAPWLAEYLHEMTVFALAIGPLGILFLGTLFLHVYCRGVAMSWSWDAAPAKTLCFENWRRSTAGLYVAPSEYKVGMTGSCCRN
jgi:hypothetical protein